jgi:phenylacetate-coenzyme A ligase PaaK-like adenylate-forming protein
MAGGLAEAMVALDLLRAQHAGARGLEGRQQVRLRDLVNHARQHSALYRDHYRSVPSGAVRLADLPPVTKPQLMAGFDQWVTDPAITRAEVQSFLADHTRIGEPYLGHYWVCTTSGTTGRPGVFVHDERAVAVYRALALRIDATWMSPRQWLAVAANGLRWASVVGTGGHFAGVGWIGWERRRSRWRRRAYRVFSVQQPLAALAAALEAFDPAILTGYPSALAQLAAEQRAGRLHLAPILVEATGESFLPAERAGLCAAFPGADVHEAYAASEFQVIALDCPNGWLHVNSDWVILEPIDVALGPSPPGTPSHTVLLTNLANQVQPIIRYDLGDSILTRPDPCECGNPMPAIRVAGRRDDVLRLRAPDGREITILPLAVGAVLEQVGGLRRSQIVQTGPTSLCVRAEPDPGLPMEHLQPVIAPRLTEYLAAQGLPDISLDFDGQPPTGDARSGKYRQVIGQQDDPGPGRQDN